MELKGPRRTSDSCILAFDWRTSSGGPVGCRPAGGGQAGWGTAGGGPVGAQYDKCAAAVPTADTARPQRHCTGSGSPAEACLAYKVISFCYVFDKWYFILFRWWFNESYSNSFEMKFFHRNWKRVLFASFYFESMVSFAKSNHRKANLKFGHKALLL